MSEQNLISGTIKQSDTDAVMAALQVLDANLRMLLRLAPQERQQLPKMGDIRRTFVQNSVSIATQNSQVFPPRFDPEFAGFTR
jgi:hypothetical protein